MDLGKSPVSTSSAMKPPANTAKGAFDGTPYLHKACIDKHPFPDRNVMAGKLFVKLRQQFVHETQLCQCRTKSTDGAVVGRYLFHSPKNREKVIESLMRSSKAQSLRLYHVFGSNILNKRITS